MARNDRAIIPDNVQLHVLQEVWELCHSKVADDTTPEQPEQACHQVFLAISTAAYSGKCSDNTMQFSTSIQGHAVSILLDSGSTHSFISFEVASQLSGRSSCHTPLWVIVGNGTKIQCSDEYQNLQWAIQQCHFVSTVNVLPLIKFDMIMGMDWLARYSPTQVDWKLKWVTIPYESSQVQLQGELASLPARSVIQVAACLGDETSTATPPLSPAVQSLLSKFRSVFAPPNGYPPARFCDHTIPLVPGAAPVQLRP